MVGILAVWLLPNQLQGTRGADKTLTRRITKDSLCILIPIEEFNRNLNAKKDVTNHCTRIRGARGN